MWVIPVNGSTVCGLPASVRRCRELRRYVGDDDVVVGQRPWIKQQRPPQSRRIVQQRRTIVGRLIGAVGIRAQVALCVVGVVQPPLGDRRTGDPGMEDVRTPPVAHGEHAARKATEGPAADRDARQIELGMIGRHALERRDLILERGRREVAVHCPRPCHTAAWGSSPVGDDHGEPLIGEPLRLEPIPTPQSRSHTACGR